MAITYGLAPNPVWYLTDIVGKNLAGGFIYSYDSLNKAVPKAIYKDSAGTTAWPNPIILDMNGTTGPLYFAFNSATPTDLYYLEIRDAQGVLQWTFDNFPIIGSGNGGASSTVTSLSNLVLNGTFWRNTGTSSTPVGTYTPLCPSLHAGFGGNARPDIFLLKNNTAANDTITFPAFPLGTAPLAPDCTPEFYFNYTCTNSPAGETFKDIYTPLCKGVQNLANQNQTLTFWARSNNGNPALPIYWYQFYGDGGAASTSTKSLITSVILSNTWTRYTINAVAPDPSGKVLGTCGNDATYWLIGLPLGVPSNIDLTKLGDYLGGSVPTTEFINYDIIEARAITHRTGEVRLSYNTTEFGYVPMNDGNIGSAASGATTRANIDTFPLYSLLWTNVSDTYAPVSTGRGASAIADFTANKTIGLTKQLGRAIASAGLPSSGGSGTTWALGQTTGEELHVLTVPELAAHTHTPGQAFDYVGVPGPATAALAGGATVGQTSFLNTGSTGGNVGHNTIQPTAYLNVFLKL